MKYLILITLLSCNSPARKDIASKEIIKQLKEEALRDSTNMMLVKFYSIGLGCALKLARTNNFASTKVYDKETTSLINDGLIKRCIDDEMDKL